MFQQLVDLLTGFSQIGIQLSPLPPVLVSEPFPLFPFEAGFTEPIGFTLAVIVAAAGGEQTETRREFGKAGDVLVCSATSGIGTIGIVHFETGEAGVNHPVQSIFEIAHPLVDPRMSQHGLPACCIDQFNGILCTPAFMPAAWASATPITLS